MAMSIELVLIAIALVFAVAIRRNVTQIFRTRYQHKWTLLVALCGHLFIEFAPLNTDLYNTVGFGVVMFTYLMLFSFVIANINFKAMWIVFIGLAANAVTTGLNGGMPVRETNTFVARETMRYQPQTSDDLLSFLGSNFIVEPINMAFSVGDIIFAVGIFVFALTITRKTKENIQDQEPEMVRDFEEEQLQMQEVMAEAGVSKNLLMKSGIMDVGEYIDITQDDPVTVTNNPNTDYMDSTREDEDSTQDNSGSTVHVDEVDVEPINDSRKASSRSERKTPRRGRKRWQRSYGLKGLPSVQELGFDEQSMEIVDAADGQ